MALTATPVFPQTPILGVQNFKPADASNLKTVYTAGANGSKVVALTATSTETASARVAQVWITRSAVSYLLTSVNIPVNSGFDGITPAIDLLTQAILPSLPFSGGAGGFDGQTFLYLQSGDTLQVSMTSTITAGKEIDVLAVGSNY